MSILHPPRQREEYCYNTHAMIDTPAPVQNQPQTAPAVPSVPQTMPAPPSPTPVQPSPPAPPSKKPVLPTWAVWTIVSVLTILLLTGALYISLRLSSPDELVIQNQAIETEIRVQSLRVSQPGFLIVYQLKNADLVGSVIAESFYLFPQTYMNFAFPLKPEVDAKTLTDSLFMGVLYKDTNGSQYWEPKEDREVKTLFGKQVKSLFRNTALPDVVQ